MYTRREGETRKTERKKSPPRGRQVSFLFFNLLGEFDCDTAAARGKLESIVQMRDVHDQPNVVLSFTLDDKTCMEKRRLHVREEKAEGKNKKRGQRKKRLREGESNEERKEKKAPKRERRTYKAI